MELKAWRLKCVAKAYSFSPSLSAAYHFSLDCGGKMAVSSPSRREISPLFQQFSKSLRIESRISDWFFRGNMLIPEPIPMAKHAML